MQTETNVSGQSNTRKKKSLPSMALLLKRNKKIIILFELSIQLKLLGGPQKPK